MRIPHQILKILAPVACGVLLLFAANGSAWGQRVSQFQADAERAVKLVEAGKFDEAKKIADRLVRQATSYDHAVDLNALGNAFYEQHYLPGAEVCSKRVLEICEKQYGSNNHNTMTALNSLALVYNYQARYAEAEPLLKRVLAFTERQNGRDHLETANSQFSLAELYLTPGNYKHAARLLKLALATREKRLGKDHTDTCRILNNLASTYDEQGRYAETEQLYLRVLEISRKRLGMNHPDTAQSLANLAVLYDLQARYAEAESFYKQALEILENHFGKDHPIIAKPISNFASYHSDRGHYVEAELLCKRALEINKKYFGEEHPDTALSLVHLAAIYERQGRYTDAEPLYNKALEIYEKTIGKDHHYISSTLGYLANLYVQQGRSAKAEPLFKRVLEFRKKQFGEEHHFTAESLCSMASIYQSQDRFFEAEQSYKRGLEIIEKQLGKDHIQTAIVLGYLARLNFDKGSYEEAIPLYTRAIDILDKCNAAADTRLRKYFSRAISHSMLNHRNEAVTDLKEAMNLSLEVRKQASGSDEQRAETFAQYYNVFETMVDWQYKLGDMAEAYEAMERSRAQGLQDLVNSSGIDLLAGIPDATAKKLRADEAAALTAVASCEKQLEVLPKRTDMTEAQKKTEETKLLEALKVARKNLVDAMAAIRSASPAYRLMIAEDRKPISFETVQKELSGEKTLALEYLIGKEKSYLLVYGMETPPVLLPLELDDNQAKLFDVEPGMLTASKMDAILQNAKNDGVLQSIADQDRIPENGLPDATTARKLNVLWSVLIPDKAIRDRIVDDSFEYLLVLPDGALAKLPFEMLIVEPDIISPQYLLDRGPAVVYAPSASMYYNLKQQKKQTTAKKALTVGDPDYASQPGTGTGTRGTLQELSRSRRAGRFGVLERLEWTARETEWIADSCKKNGFSDVKRFDQKESTEANVRKNLAGCRLVHLACHGMAEEEYGNMFGALALTVGNPDDPKDDGFLELAEMFGLDLKACELAILSACETNLGPNQHGEGTWSMSRGLLASGARRVVTTDWQVADDASARLVFFFVDAVNKSGDFNDIAKSLRKAKLSARSDPNNTAWKHPYYWAPFVLIGEK